MTLEKKDKAEAKSSAAVYKRRYDKARTAYFRMESPTDFNKRKIEWGRQLVQELGIKDTEGLNDVRK